VTAGDSVLVRGLRDTGRTLEGFSVAPWRVLGRWAGGAAAIAALLLAAVVVIASVVTPDPTPVVLPGLTSPATPTAVVHVIGRNALVLALHSFACLAGFIAGSSLPAEAERYGGAWRRVHDHAGPLAIAFVIAATSFSLLTQAYALGGAAATLAAQGGVSPALLLLGLLPHALPELTALFLPLAAWIGASRRGAWHELLAATLVTTGLAIPVLVIAAFVEVYVSPHVLLWLRG
jgi:stage II sporulation SpoM-like protein